MDFNWAKRLGLIRKPANFISSISDDRGEELSYGGMPISEAFKQDIGVGRSFFRFVSSHEAFLPSLASLIRNFIYRVVLISLWVYFVGGVLSLLWFRRRLPAYATKFIEMVLMVSADHGPAVSGAHNTIVAARAGKDLVSSLCSGLLTIGPR
jgi:ATP citrate (pro-S)-lyase